MVERIGGGGWGGGQRYLGESKRLVWLAQAKVSYSLLLAASEGGGTSSDREREPAAGLLL